MCDFYAIHKFFLITLNWFRCFDGSGFKGREMKSTTASDKNGKSAIVVFACTCRVLQEMLLYSGERSFSFKASDWLARAG